MTELTTLDWVFLGLLIALTVALMDKIVTWLYWGDERAKKDSQCPPHEWAPYYADLPDGTYKFVGLRCGKCKRTPGGMSSGGGTWPLFPAI